MINTKCQMINWCGEEYCKKSYQTRDNCINCAHYSQIDSCSGYCYGVPPVTHYSGLFGLKRSQKAKIVPWCMRKCGTFKKEKQK